MGLKRRVRDFGFVENEIRREELPKDATLESIDVLITGDIDGAGGGVPLNPALLLDRVELLANGKPLYDLSGYELYKLDSCLQGEDIENAIGDPAGLATTPLMFLLRLHMNDPRGLTPRRSLVDVRNLDQLSINLSFGAVTDIFTGGVQTLANLRARIFYNEDRGRGGDVVVVNRSFTYVLTGARMVEEWKERGATMRSILAFLTDDTGAAIDTGLDVFGIRIDGKEPVIDELPFELLRTQTTFDTGLSAGEIDTGMAYIDLDTNAQGRPLQSLDNVNVELILEGTVDYTIRLIRRQYLPLASYLGVRAGRR